MISPRVFAMLAIAMICGLVCCSPMELQAQANSGLERPGGLEIPEDTTAQVLGYQYIDRADSIYFGHSQIQSAIGDNLDSLSRFSNTLPVHCTDRPLHAAGLDLRLDLGKNYNYGSNSFSASVNVSISGWDSNHIPTLLHPDIALTINEDAPEQLFHVEYHGIDSTDFLRSNYFRILVNSYSASTLVQPDIRLTASYREEYAIGGVNSSSPETAVLSPVEKEGATVRGNPVELQWELDNECDSFPGYQVQLLRLYNIDSALKEETEVRALVDWRQALTVETADGRPKIDLTIAEGSGYYLWRVRPVGSIYPGGIADARNWGVWSPAPAQGAIVTYLAPNDTALPDAGFYYEQFDDDKNWMYGRVFAEEGRMGEAMSYFTSGGVPRQSQTKVLSDGGVIIGETVGDYTGRISAGSMSVPVEERALSGGGNGFFGYVPDVMTSGSEQFSAQHFDADGNFRNPEAIDGGESGNYYSSSGVDAEIPDAGGYPYIRSRYSTDGTGRLAEQSGVGPVHRIGGDGGGKDRTARVFYSSVSNTELVSLFGDEAPVDTSVHKVLVLDPNKVTSVQYISKEGQVIATALQRPQGDTLLQQLTETSRINGTISDTMRGDRARGEFSFSSNKRLSFTDTTTLTLTYRITPNAFETAACDTFCTTCDYNVRVIVHDVENPDSTKEYSLVIGAEEDCEEPEQRELTETITLPPGTYIVERRAEANTIDTTTIDPSNPFGDSYAAAFRARVAGEMNELIRSNSTIVEVMRLLNQPEVDFDSLYRYLGVHPDTVSKKIIYTECCAVEIPIIDPKCGFDPCRDSIPDFERHLFNRWKDEFASDPDSLRLNEYFKFDGDGKYPSSLDYPDGNGAFNFMIGKMLQEKKPDSSYVYDCAELWNAWDGIVQSFDRLARKDTANPAYNLDFDLLETFLDATGRIYSNASTLPYHSTSGYMLYAYKYIHYEISDDLACESATGYNTGWHNNPDSSDRWNSLRLCIMGKSRGNSDLDDEYSDCFLSEDREEADECMIALKEKMESDCRSHCYGRRDEFLAALTIAYDKAGVELTPEAAYCMAQTMADSCSNGCQLSVFYDGEDHISGIGTEDEWEAMQKMHRYKAEVSIPDSTMLEGLVCDNDSMTLYQGWTQPRTNLIASHLNSRLEEFRATVGVAGTNWNFKEALREIASDIVNTLEDSIVFVPAGDSSRFVLQGCELWYVTDSLVRGSPQNPHPAVAHLNAYLDTAWGTHVTIDSADVTYMTTMHLDSNDYYTFNNILEPLTSIEFKYSYLLHSFPFVNGNVEPIQLSSLFYPQWYYPHYPGWLLSPSDTTYRMGVFTLHRQSISSPSFYLYLNHYYTYDHEGVIDSISYSINTTNYDADYIYQSTAGKQELLQFFNTRHTEALGKFGQDASGHLVYTDIWRSPDSTFRVHDIRFFGLQNKRLHTNICDTMICPPICMRWVERDSLGGYKDPLLPEPCVETAARQIRDGINSSIGQCIAEKVAHLHQLYRDSCINSDNVDDTLIISYPIDYYHFTLYYYDRAGNVVRTVAPKGVNLLSAGSTRMDPTAHLFYTEYEYNSLGQLLRTKSPDADSSRIWYDQWGRPRFSQERRQSDSGVFAYVKYDQLGRIVESGISSDTLSSFPSYVNDSGFPATGTERSFIVFTDSSGIEYLDGSPQRNLRNRVSYVYNDDGATTHYSYDPHGNVEWIAQELPDLPVASYVKYDYELISGNVLEVKYNEGRADQFYHRYEYDADNRVTAVKTSRDGYIWDRDARYSYYRLGALARREIGEDSLQGLDYTYTLQGWLKAVNHPSLDATDDPGGDGSASGFPADSFAVELGYFAGDYVRSGSSLDSSASTGLPGSPLYGGNISSTTSHVGKTTGARYEQLTGEVYRYDQLERLKSSDFRFYDSGTWNSTTQYSTRYAYDANGNLDTLVRRAYDTLGSNRMDSLRYQYVGGGSSNNRLLRAEDAVTGEPYREDIASGQTGSNYRYDGSGNLVRDEQEKMDLQWDGGGRLRRVEKRPASNHWAIVEYLYDAGGNRVKRTVTDRNPSNAGTTISNTWYVYDAAGTVMAIYEQNCTEPYDTDLDGIADSVDNCPYTSNPNQADNDGDGIGNVCDKCPQNSDATNADADRDGRGDACDNCVNTWNPNQRDLNANGVGDICEPGSGYNPDSDGDGVPDKLDPCPTTYNATIPAPDADSDGIPDECDNCPDIANSTQADVNLNSIGDACDSVDCPIKLIELPVYGIAREGVVVPNGGITLGSSVADTIYTRRIGEKLYELTDHLGNVRGVIGDRRLSDIVSGVPGKFRADMRRYSNLYPYGMEMPGRYYAGSGYRYGYNGMEQDSSSTGDHYTTYFRQYDARLGRFWSVDPITHSWESPYAAMGGNPVAMVDPLGANPTGTGTKEPEWTFNPECNCSRSSEVVVSEDRHEEGETIDIGLGASLVWTWGEQGWEQITGTAYDSKLDEYARNIHKEGASLADQGFGPDRVYSPQFFDRLVGVVSNRWARYGPTFPGGTTNPFFVTHALESDPIGDAILTMGFSSLLRLGAKSLAVSARALASSGATRNIAQEIDALLPTARALINHSRTMRGLTSINDDIVMQGGSAGGGGFKSGDIIMREFATKEGPLEMAAEVVINGRTLHLKDIAIYPRGAGNFQLGAREVLVLRNQIAAEARTLGFEQLRITGLRYTGANPGKIVDFTLDLTK